jgi:hypothetical protein
MTILTFPSAPINGGTFDLASTNSNFSVCQLTPNKFLAVYRQNSPSFTLAQVVNIIDKNTVTFGNIWVINSINVTTSVVVKKIKGTTDKALLICADEPSKTLYTQILTVDSNDDISASPFSTFVESSGNRINLMNVISFNSYNNRMVINFNYNDNDFLSRKIMIDTTLNTATILGGSIYFGGISGEFYGSYQDDIDSSNDQYCVIVNTSTLNRFTVLKRNFPGLDSTTSFSSPSVATTVLKSGIFAVPTGNISKISNILKLGNFLYFTTNTGTTPSTNDTLCEFNLSTNSETFYTLTGGSRYANLEKIDDYHYVEVQNALITSSIGTEMKMRVLRILLPGILESPLNPITVLPSQSVEFRRNYRSQSSPLTFFTNLNKNTFLINSNLFCYFYKTSENYRVALLYN